MRVLVLVSGGGTNLQALLDAQTAGTLGGTDAEGKANTQIVAVISDRDGAYALERARAAGIPALVEAPDRGLPKERRREDLSARLLARARETGADLIFLAGFLSILSEPLVPAYAGRILNLHPSLLPKFGGAGMFGDRVHRAVLEAKETQSGCTVHWVDAGTDTGPILLQRKVPVHPDDSPASLAERIHQQEHIAVVQAVGLAARLLAPVNAATQGALR